MVLPKYNSPFSVGKRQTMFIDPNDPRIRGYKYGITASRVGSEIQIVNSNGISQSGSFSYLKNASPGAKSIIKTPEPKPTTKPGDITNLAAAWEDLAGGATLVITFDFDFSDDTNKYVSSFQYDLTNLGNTFTTNLIESKILNQSGTSQRIEFSELANIDNFGEFQVDFAQLRVAAVDSSGNPGNFSTLTDIPEYTNNLPTPVITVTSILQGYSVDWTTVSQQFEFVSIEEVISNAGTAPTTGYEQVYLGVSSIKPARVTTATTEARWVRIRFNNKGTLFSQYSNAVKVTPTNPISADLVPPAEVTAVAGVWSGDNIIISYTLPATDAGSRFQIGLTAPNSSVGYFYAFPSGTSLNQTYTITKADLFSQFGSHYSSYTGILKSIDAADNRTSGVSFTVAQRANPLVGITPTFTTTALVNGYSVSYTLPAGAVYAEVYQKYTSWSGVTPVDSFTGSYSSGGASGTNTVTLSSVVDNDGGTVTTIPTGYIVIGTGIPENTYITAVSGNQITVSNNFTAQVSGSITGYGIVYSGTSPANISSTLYQNTYLLVRYYDDFENASNYSAEQIVVPLSPVTVDTTGPGNVSQTGMSTSAGIDTSGTLGFNGYINLSWAAVTESSLRGYRIRFTTDTSSPVYSHVDYPIDQTNIPTGTLSYKLQGLAVGATYKIGIATYDQYNNTSTDYISFTDTEIAGTPAITDYITAGNFQFGQGVDANNITNTGSGMKRGLFFDDSNYWFLNSSDSARLKVGGTSNNYILWDGADFTIDGDINARGGEFSGNIELSTLGASIYNGDVTTSPGNLTGDGFIFNKDGLLIRKGSNQVSLDTTNGAITANNGNIADWVISASKIEKLDPSTTKYAGLSSTGTYKFWAGSTVAGGDTTQFAVNNAGKVWAQDIQISGGTLDVGPAAPNGFHVNTSGQLTASSVNLSGQIKATSGEISGNFIVKPTGSIIAGTGTSNANSVIIKGADGSNYGGLAAFDNNEAALTEILTKPISSGNTPRGNPISSPIDINFFTKAAYIGGWIFGPTQMYSSDGQFVIDSTSTTNEIRIYGSESGTNYLLKVGKSNSTTTPYVIWAGPISSGVLGTPKFTVSQQGVLTAVNADIKGTLSVDDGTMKFGDNADGSGTDGLYINANNKWFKSGSFKVGSATRYVEWNGNTLSIVGDLSFGSSDYLNADGSVKMGNGTIQITTGGDVTFATGSISFTNVGEFLSDENNYAGDPTITLNTSNKLTQGRRLIYNVSSTPQNPYSWNNTTKTGDFLWKGTTAKPVKTGDLIFTT